MQDRFYPPEDRRLIAEVVGQSAFRDLLDLPTLAWQELGIVLACYTTVIGGAALYLMGLLPYWLLLPADVLAIYATFTPLHDATHGSVSSNRRLNDLIGTVAALPLFPGITTAFYRYLHLEHHRNTGDPQQDPDEITVSAKMPWAPLVWMFIDLIWLSWYLRRINTRSTRDLVRDGITILFFVAWHVGWLMSPYAWEFVLLWWIPQRLGIMLLAYLFASIQHPEGELQVRRPLQATRMYEGGFLTRLFMISQSQHLMHHLYPAIPYYRYNDAWELSEPVLRDREIMWSNLLGHRAQPDPLPPAGASMDEAVPGHAFTAELARSGKTVHVAADQSLLDALRDARIMVPAVCQQGLCGTCACKVLEGEVDHRDSVLRDAHKARGMMTSCVSRAAGEKLVLDL